MSLVTDIADNEEGLRVRITQLLESVQTLLEGTEVVPSDDVQILTAVRDDLVLLTEMVHEMTIRVNARLGL